MEEGLNLTAIIVASVGSGIVSTLGTVAALKVHIAYLKENINRIDRSVQRAHGRIDMLEGKHNAQNT